MKNIPKNVLKRLATPKNMLKKLAAPKGSFLYQLTVSFIVGIMTLILLASIVTSWLASNRTKSDLIKQGHQITGNLARQSTLALLYGEGENAKDAARGALAFPDVLDVYIYDTRFRLILHEGKNFKPEIIYFSPIVNTNTLILDEETHWRFRAPVYSQVSQDNEFDVQGADTKPELLGYADVVLSKDTLVDTTTNIFVVNSIIFFSLAMILLLVLRFMAKKIIQPLNKLSSTMYNAESGVENAYADEEDGPQEAKVIAHAFNQMIKAINERDKELKNQNLTLENRVKNRTVELAEARDKAIEASKTKSRFLANMSHELRTPLNAIIGYSELLMEDAIDKDNQSDYSDLHKIHSAGVHLLSLINNILDLSKIEAGKIDLYLEAFMIKTLIADVLLVIEPLVKKNNNTFRIDCPKDIGSMCSDETKIRQSLLNLISNACKFTKNGEVILVVRPHKVGTREGVSFQVSDQGIGMTEIQVGNLFREFTQADSSTTREYGGTGLGLAISKHFCEMMGGYIRVKSVKDEGSVFTMYLPRVANTNSTDSSEEDTQELDDGESMENKAVTSDTADEVNSDKE